MAHHKDRSGKLLVSGLCRSEKHQECGPQHAEFSDAFDVDIVCHCDCHPDDGCVPTIKRRPKRNPICAKCHLQHPGECD